MKSIKHILSSQKVNMGGIILDQPLPQGGIEQVDPYLLIHHWIETLPGGQHPKDVGVGPHPHRGFSPITFVYKGAVHHKDSRGHDSIVRAGGTQWMFAGRGITHSERPPKEMAEEGGDLEFIQIWLNAPAEHKMDQPEYFPLSDDETPRFVSDDQKINVGVVSGSFNSVDGPISHLSPATILRFDAQAGGHIKFDIPKAYNTILYLLNGSVTINGKHTITDKQLIVFDQDHDTIEMKATSASNALLLSGLPIGESVSSYGPFVMNTQTEVMEALRDAQMGKMGVLIE